MKVVEVFSSIQGEGVHIGRRVTFVRLAGCNLRCQFCDTRYAFTGGEELTNEELDERIIAVDPNYDIIVFTGGEPMLQWDAIRAYREFTGVVGHYHIETNGTMWEKNVPHYISHAAVSPKLLSACVGGYDLDVLNQWLDVDSVEFKFVVTSHHDLHEILAIAEELSLRWASIPIILQPDGQLDDYDLALRRLYRWVQGWELSHYVRILPQLHRVMWGKGARGV